MTLPGVDRFQQAFRQPYAPILPWIAFVTALMVLSYGLHALVLGTAEQERGRLEGEWVKARQQLNRHKEAKKAKADLKRVWAVLPLYRDFAPLALGVTEEAKRDQVTLPALSYKTEKTGVPNATKAVLQGTVSGHYEDLRRFLYNLESAEELLFIEDLNLIRSGNVQDQQLTFNIRISTYLRGEHIPSQSPNP
ncbi:MAG TPA: type 4a pilus biogenesis protein PilO [Nitrospira sp.]|jgi:Tfp pilus assembly protein PilO|nr:type 4a pilus biogenesis protein PilO [Nitrospira sp.]